MTLHGESHQKRLKQEELQTSGELRHQTMENGDIFQELVTESFIKKTRTKERVN